MALVTSSLTMIEMEVAESALAWISSTSHSTSMPSNHLSSMIPQVSRGHFVTAQRQTSWWPDVAGNGRRHRCPKLVKFA